MISISGSGGSDRPSGSRTNPNLIGIETDNGVFYAYDSADSTKFATVPRVDWAPALAAVK